MRRQMQLRELYRVSVQRMEINIQGESDMESEYTTVICKKALGGYSNKAWISACVEAELAFFHFEIAAKPSSK